MSDWFDDFSRALATPMPMPRRHALRFFGATFAGIWLAGFRPPRALADRDCSGQQICVPGNANCFTICCPTDLICCTGPPDPSSRSGCRTNPHCCDPCNPNGSKCLGNGSCGPGPIADSCRCPAGQVKCGQECCSAGEVCSGGRCSRSCPPGTTRCGVDCCKQTEKCTSIRVGASSALVCQPGCPTNHARCGDRCCPKNWRCANARTGLCKKCSSGQKQCGKKCCPRGQFCCNPEKGVCCNKGADCCNVAPAASSKEQWTCCPQGHACAPMILPGQSGITSSSPRVCCPSNRVVPLSGSKVCCPPGKVSLGGKLVVPPGGGGGLCCDANRVCGSGASITCCSSAPGFEQRCVNGVCQAA